MNTNRLLASLATFAVFAAPTVATAQLIKSFQFNDAAGTTLTNVGFTGAAAGAFSTDVAGIATNGTGALSFAGYSSAVTTPAANYSYASLGSIAPDPVNGGLYEFNVTIAGWDLPSGSTNQQTVYVELRSTAATSSNLVADLTFLASDAGVSVRFRDSAAANNNTFLTGLASTRTTPLTITYSIDRKNNTYSIRYDDNGTLGVVITDDAFSSGSAGRNIAFLDVRAGGNFTASDFRIDSITFTQIPEPSSYAALAGLGGLALAVLGRRGRKVCRR